MLRVPDRFSAIGALVRKSSSYIDSPPNLSSSTLCPPYYPRSPIRSSLLMKPSEPAGKFLLRQGP